MGIVTPIPLETTTKIIVITETTKNDKLKLYHAKLKDYRYCSDMADVQYGYYIRWIPLKNPENLKLTNGGILMDIDIINNCVQLKVKLLNHRIIQIKFDECVIFQKLSHHI